MAILLLVGVADAEPRIESGVVYAEIDGEQLLLDVYRPAKQDAGVKYPAVVLIHGGGWQGGDRLAGSMVGLGKALADAGYVAFSIDYRLVKPALAAGPDKRWLNQYPVPIEDCRRAVRWIREHAVDYGADATKMGAAGDSAGGHLVSMLGTSDVSMLGSSDVSKLGTSDGNEMLSSRVQAVVDIYGPSDITGDYSKFTIGAINVQELVDSFVPTSDAKREASPLFHIDEKSAAFLIFHGDADPIVGVEQSRNFHAALQKAGRVSEYVEFPGAGHGFGGKEWEAMVAKSIAFFNRELKGKGGGGEGNAEDSAVKPAVTSAAKPQADVDWGEVFQIHYTNRVRAFREQNEVFENVVLLGDSITEGFDVAKFLPGRRVLNRGIGGDVIGNALPEDDKRGILARLDESVFDCSATHVFLLVGINDLGSGRKPEVMEQGYRQILEQIKKEAPRVRVHVQSVLPCSGQYAKHNANVLDFNARLEKLAAEFDYDYLDLHELMIDGKGELRAEFTGDGLHLNAAGYAPWKAEVERVMGWRK